MKENAPQKISNIQEKTAAKREKLSLYLALAAVILLWSSAFVGIRYTLSNYHPGALALFRFLIASISMLVLYLNLPQRRIPTLKELLSMMGLGIVGIGIYNLALNVGEISVNASIASFIISLIPIVTMILAVLFFKEPISKKGSAGVLVSFFGLILMGGSEIFTTHASFGLLCLCLATVCGASYTLLQRHFVNRFHPIEVTSYIIWGGTLCFLYFTPILLDDIQHASLSQTLTIFYLGIFPAAIAYAAWGYVISKLKPSKAALYLYLLPISSTIMSILFLHEIPSTTSLFGGLMTLIGAIYTAKHH